MGSVHERRAVSDVNLHQGRLLLAALLVAMGCDTAPGRRASEPTSGATAASGTFGADASVGSGGAGGAGGSPTSVTRGTYAWPTAPGWSAEKIPFPLPFAPELPYQGVEELRFAPSFFEPEATSYWSYAFAWWLDDAAPLDQPALTGALTEYFRGLCAAVGGVKFQFEPEHFKTTLTLAVPQPASGSAYEGQIETYDPFTTGNALTLMVKARVFECGTHPVLLMGASPKGYADPTWSEVSEVLGLFECL
jgi:hypothetical protein